MNVLHKADASNRSKVLAAAGKWGNLENGCYRTPPTRLCQVVIWLRVQEMAKGIQRGVEKCSCSVPNVLQQLKHVACWMLDVCKANAA